MKRKFVAKRHHEGRGRTLFGLGLSTLAFFWLAKKLGWLGVGTSGIGWPILLLVVGLAIVLGSRKDRTGHHSWDEKTGTAPGGAHR